LARRAAILYEVVVTVSPEIRAAYLAWLKPHMEKMLTFDGFQSAEMFVNAESDCEITSQYRVRDRAAMDAYLAGPAKALRADGVKRFGDGMRATRRILTVL
jgi:antibiotic biosynthesis monooxygenase (ABM) superfamily enzyme